MSLKAEIRKDKRKAAEFNKEVEKRNAERQRQLDEEAKQKQEEDDLRQAKRRKEDWVRQKLYNKGKLELELEKEMNKYKGKVSEVNVEEELMKGIDKYKNKRLPLFSGGEVAALLDKLLAAYRKEHQGGREFSGVLENLLDLYHEENRKVVEDTPSTNQFLLDVVDSRERRMSSVTLEPYETVQPRTASSSPVLDSQALPPRTSATTQPRRDREGCGCRKGCVHGNCKCEGQCNERCLCTKTITGCVYGGGQSGVKRPREETISSSGQPGLTDEEAEMETLEWRGRQLGLSMLPTPPTRPIVIDDDEKKERPQKRHRS